MVSDLLNHLLVLAGVAVYAGVVYALYVSLANSSFTTPVGTGGAGSSARESDGGHVHCATCGTSNEHGYRFCRHCATNLAQ